MKPSPVNPILQGSPGVGAQALAPDFKPPRGLARGRRVGESAMAGMLELARSQPPRKPPARAQPASTSTPASSNGPAIGVAVAASLALAVIGGVAMADTGDE